MCDCIERISEKMKPILFSTPIVQAILAGRKTQTRRVIKPQPCQEATEFSRFIYHGDTGWEARFANGSSYAVCDRTIPIDIGDILWVRETWSFSRKPFKSGIHKYYYKADGAPKDYIVKFRWHPSIHMPHEAARIFLRVTNVRVERLNNISEDDAKAEGIKSYWRTKEGGEGADDWHESNSSFVGIGDVHPTRKEAFAECWDSINAKQGYGWDTNPWVWVYEFERAEKGGAGSGARITESRD